MTPRVAVVGGGAAGMLAALSLAERGAEVSLLESASRLGGVLRSVQRDGWLAEAGPNTVAEPAAEVRALLDRAGLATATVRPDPAMAKRYLVHHGALAALPRSAAELVAWPVLSTVGRMRLLKEPFLKAGPADDEETVEHFARRRLGAEVAERVFDPLVSGTSAGDPSQLLVRYAFPRMLEWERDGGSLLKGAMRAGMQARRKAGRGGAPRGVWSCRGGLADVGTHVEARLGDVVRCGVRVTAIERRDGGVDVIDAEGQRERFDGVVCCAPVAALGAIGWDREVRCAMEPLLDMPHASVSTVTLGFLRRDVAHPLDGFGMLVPSSERRSILGTVFASTLFRDRTPAGHVLLTTFVGGMRRPELAALDDAALQDLVRGELAGLLGATGTPAFTHVAHWPASQPQAVAGHAQRLAAAERAESVLPGVVFAGAWRDGLAVGDAMRGGLAAAERLVERMGWDLPAVSSR